MPSFTASRKELLSFIDTFSKGVDNLAIRVKAEQITVAVGALTHYLRRSMDCQDGDPGKIYISDLVRFNEFLKAAKAAEVTVSQSARGRPIQVKAGRSSLELPSSTYIASETDVPLIERVVGKAEDNMWQSFGEANLPACGNVTGTDLYGISKASKVIGSGITCKVDYRPKDNELALMAEQKNKGKMFAAAEAEPVSGTQESYQSHYAHWLPELLNTVPDSVVQFHMGESAPFVVRDLDGSYLLIVFDQEVDE
jgi:hypothetical protein